MPEREIEPDFERHVAQRLWAYSEQVVQPFDAVEIAHRAATGNPRPRSASFFGGFVPAPVMWLVLSSLLLLALTATAFAAGWLRVPEPVVQPSPTLDSTPADSPTPSSPEPPSPSPEPLPGSSEPTPSEPAPASPDPGPTQPLPTTSPVPVTPAPSPSAVIEPSPPPTAVPTLGDWRLLNDFPAGDEEFVRVTGVAAGGPGFVAVGWSGDGAGGTEAARAWTSPDGEGWLVHASESFAGARLEIVVRHDGELYAFGPIPTDDPDYPLVGAYNLWRSADGASWEQLPQPEPFADGGVLLGALSTDSALIAYGYRQPPDASGSQPAVWISVDGHEWQTAETLPATWDVRGMAVADGLLVAIGNSRSEEAPWRSLAYSTDGGRNWRDASVPLADDPQVTLEAVAAQPGSFVAVGWHGRQDDVSPVVLHSTNGSDWSAAPVDGFRMHQFERVVSAPGGFLAFANEVRYEIDPDCAPQPCADHVPVGGRTLSSADGTTWQPDSSMPSPIVWLYAGIAVGEDGVVVGAFDTDFNSGVWFAPLAAPLR